MQPTIFQFHYYVMESHLSQKSRDLRVGNWFLIVMMQEEVRIATVRDLNSGYLFLRNQYAQRKNDAL